MADTPGAARAVGRAMATNPLAPFVPCHRVVGAGGKLTGYAWGLDMKRRLLAHELTHIRNRDVQLLVIAAVFVGIVAFLAQSPTVASRPGWPADVTAAVGRALVGPLALAVELLGVLLVLALLGALYLARSER